MSSNTNYSKSAYTHPNDPELVCTDRQLSVQVENEIKEGFFELRQKFNDSGSSSIYISHPVLHEKHPVLKKVELSTLKLILKDSQIIYLEPQ